MGMKSRIVHARNRFPGAKVESSESGVRVYSKAGTLLAACHVNGLGAIVDAQADMGAKYPFSLEPLPRNARFVKLFKDGSIKHAEEFSERKAIADKLAAKHGYVPSIVELAKLGYKINAEDPRAEAVLTDEVKQAAAAE